MSPRMVLNRIYAHLVRDLAVEDRSKFDDELYAPGGDLDLFAYLDEHDDDNE
jgi:hypothetical protein